MTIQEFQAKMQSNENHGKLFEAVRSMARAENSQRLMEEAPFSLLSPWG